MSDAISRHLEQLSMQLEAQMTKAGAKLTTALEQETHRLADIEARLRHLEARDRGAEQLDLDDLDLRVSVLYDQVGRLGATLVGRKPSSGPRRPGHQTAP
jgi:hypothetical protein